MWEKINTTAPRTAPAPAEMGSVIHTTKMKPIAQLTVELQDTAETESAMQTKQQRAAHLIAVVDSTISYSAKSFTMSQEATQARNGLRYITQPWIILI